MTTAATTAADQTGAQTGDNLRNLYAVLALLCLAGAAVSTVMLVYRKKVN